MVGGALQVGIQVPALKRIGMLPRLSLNPLAGLSDPGVRRILKKMGPAVFAVSAAQISLLINTNIASRLGAGSVSVLQYADRLMEFPTGMLGVALGTVLLPSLSKANADGDPVEYSALLDWGLRLTFLLALPAAVGLAALAEPLIATLFNYGQFGAHAVTAATAPLMSYAAGLLGIILVKILAPAFYARQDIRTPVRIAIAVLVITQLLNLLLVPWLRHTGLALSISLGALLNAGWLLVGLMKRGSYRPTPGWGRFMLQVFGASVLVCVFLMWGTTTFSWIGLRAQPHERAGLMAGMLLGAALISFGALWASGVKLRHFIAR
jgi:putative peptidoglycan lipid II flippase